MQPCTQNEERRAVLLLTDLLIQETAYPPLQALATLARGLTKEFDGVVITGCTQLTVSLGSPSQHAKFSAESTTVFFFFLSQDFSFISIWNLSSFKRVKDTLCLFSFPVYYCKIFPHLLKIC